MSFLATIERTRANGTKIKELLRTTLIVHVQAERPATKINSDTYWFEQAAQIGTLRNMHDSKTAAQTNSYWCDIKYDPARPDEFRHANTRQPLHTDGAYEAHPPDISFFYCRRAALFGGATTFIEARTVQECLRLDAPQLLSRLQNEPLLFTKGTDSRQTLVFAPSQCAWNYYRLAPTPSEHGDTLGQTFQQYLETRIQPMGLVHPIQLQPGDAVFFQDNKVFHGRNAFIGNRWLRKGAINLRD